MDEDVKPVRTISDTMDTVEHFHTVPRKKSFRRNDIVINPIVFDKLEEARVKQKWKQIIGPVFAKAVTSEAYYKGTLFVNIQSPAIRNELFLNRSSIIKQVNEQLHQNLLTSIVLK